jgi:hypothetical protein
MDFLRSRIEQFHRHLAGAGSATKIIYAVGLVAIPGWIFFWQGGDQFAWLYGAQQIIDGNSVYELAPTDAANPNARVYPYLPAFAIMNAVLLFPFEILTSVLYGYADLNGFDLLGAPTGGTKGPPVYVFIGVVVIGLWSYSALVLLPVLGRSLYSTAQQRFVAVLVLVLTVYTWSDLIRSQVNTAVALFVVASVATSIRRRWLLAGLLVSVATFKFTALVVVPVILVYALRTEGMRAAGRVAIGVVIGQIPNLLYFAWFPKDLELLFEARGGLTLDSFQGARDTLALLPLRIGVLESWYIGSGYPVVLSAVVLLACLLVFKRPVGILTAAAVALLSTSLLVPGEQRIAPFAILIVLAMVGHWSHLSAKFLIGIILSLAFYVQIQSLTPDTLAGISQADVGSIDLVLPWALHLSLIIGLGYLLVHELRDSGDSRSVME